MPKTEIKIPWFSIYKNVPTVRNPYSDGPAGKTEISFYVPLDIIQEDDFFIFSLVNREKGDFFTLTETSFIDVSIDLKEVPILADGFGTPVLGSLKINRKKINADARFGLPQVSGLGGRQANSVLYHLDRKTIKLLKKFYFAEKHYGEVYNALRKDLLGIGSLTEGEFNGHFAFLIRGAKTPIVHNEKNNIRPNLGTINIQNDNSFFIYAQSSAGTAIKTIPAVDPLVPTYTWDLKYASNRTKTPNLANYAGATTFLSAGATVIGSWQGGTTGTAVSFGLEFAPNDYETYEQKENFATLIGSYSIGCGTAIVGTALLEQVLPIQTLADDLAIYTQLNTGGTPTLPTNFSQLTAGSFTYDSTETAHFSVSFKSIGTPSSEYLVATVPDNEVTFLSVYRHADSVGSAVVNLSAGTGILAYQPTTNDFRTSVPYTTFNSYGFLISPNQVFFNETKEFILEEHLLNSNPTLAGSKISAAHFCYKTKEIQTIPATQFASTESIELAGTALSKSYPAITISVPVIGTS